MPLAVIRTGTCSKCGECCSDPNDGSYQIKQGDVCQYLNPPDQGVYECQIKLDWDQHNEQWVRNKYGDIVADYFLDNCFSAIRDFPSPTHFGLTIETPTLKHADGWEAHLNEILARFNAFKTRNGCTYSFQIIVE